MSDLAEKIVKFITDPGSRFTYLYRKGFYRSLTDREYLERLFKLRMGYDLDLDDPKTLNEKLQWLKLYDQRPEYTTMVDKYAAKQWIADRIGGGYVIPTLGVWDHFDDIDLDALPESFVLKCTHDSGSIVLVPDKAKMDKAAARKKLEKGLRTDYYFTSKEWPYKNVPRRIIAEPFLHDPEHPDLIDYKIYTYGGKPVYFMYSVGEAQHNVKNHKFDTHLRSIDHLFKDTPAISAEDIRLPDNMPQMLSIAQTLCKGTQHLRVDMYNISGKIYVGELTFYSNSGFINIRSKEYSRFLADLIDITAARAARERSV